MGTILFLGKKSQNYVPMVKLYFTIVLDFIMCYSVYAQQKKIIKLYVYYGEMQTDDFIPL